MILDGFWSIFKYPQNMVQQINDHENTLLDQFRNEILSKYSSFFGRHRCELSIGCERYYHNKRIQTSTKLFLKPGYSCRIYCEVLKDGELINVLSNNDDADFYPLFASWQIDQIDFPFSNPPFTLFNSQILIQEMYEDMDEIVELFARGFVM